MTSASMQTPAPAVPAESVATAPVLEVRNLKVHFPVTRGLILQRQVGAVKAVDDVSFVIRPGETLGLVGESGSGKTTIGRSIVRLLKPTGGEIIFDGTDLAKLSDGAMRKYRNRLGIVFQDPYGALNPRMTAGRIVGEPLIVHHLTSGKGEYRERIAHLFETVGLNPAMVNRFPHEFSGGQRQRIGVARALAAQPSIIVLDEPVSALDVSIQAQVVNLLEDLQAEFGLSYLFIAHDLSVVRHISDRVAVMYLGKIVEVAKSDEIYANPLHPYTKALLSAVPIPDWELERKRERMVLTGDIPSPLNPPSGCVFHTRCPIAIADCSGDVPQLREVAPDHWVACIRV